MNIDPNCAPAARRIDFVKWLAEQVDLNTDEIKKQIAVLLENIPMKYRAVLVDPDHKTERPVECLGNSWPTVEKWVKDSLKSASSPDSFVEVYTTTEQKTGLITKKSLEREGE